MSAKWRDVMLQWFQLWKGWPTHHERANLSGRWVTASGWCDIMSSIQALSANTMSKIPTKPAMLKISRILARARPLKLRSSFRLPLATHTHSHTLSSCTNISNDDREHHTQNFSRWLIAPPGFSSTHLLTPGNTGQGQAPKTPNSFWVSLLVTHSPPFVQPYIIQLHQN